MLQGSPKSELPENLIYVTRQQYAQDHHNTATLFQYGEINTSSFTSGASLKILNPTIQILKNTAWEHMEYMIIRIAGIHPP